jgi:hypothetical protein
MANVVKLKQSDLKQVIDKVLEEQLSNPKMDNDMEGEYGVGKKLTLGQDQDGNYYVFDDEGNIIEKT